MKTKRPTAVHFAPLADEHVRSMSVLQVRCVDDLRSDKMGGKGTCGTCGQSSLECVGHFGHIELPIEVSHPMFPRQKLSVVAVPPTRMRLPNAEHDAPLTTLLYRIVRAIGRYHRSLSGSDSAKKSAEDAIRQSVLHYFGSCPSTGAAGLCARMRGKQGILRQTLMGWRVNSCARAVVSPDPCIAPWEVGVPGPIAQALGLKDGHSVLLNRQPSLHRGSIMGHVVRVRPLDRCFSISPTVTPPYNADFDGDEMNLHVCSASSAADARVLLGVEHNILSPATGMPAVRPVQDACLSWYLRSGLNVSAQKREILQSCENTGQPATARRMHAEQLAAHQHMIERGFSVGVDDFLARIPFDTADAYTLGKVAASAAQHVPASNRIATMVAAGSKGSTVNLAQLFGCVGFQTVQGRPALRPGGGSAFVSSSFVQGMSSDEFWMHACASREGMIQTAVKTADTGYLMRRMVKSFENITVAYDGTVRTASGAVVQFLYGEDGVDPCTAKYKQPCPAEPGEPVGVVSAQSIGARLTQLTLDTFHRAGVAFRYGIHRVKSLLDASTRTAGFLRGCPRPYMLPRVDLAGALHSWVQIDRLPMRAALEYRMRGMTATLCYRAEVCRSWLARHGLEMWQAAARVRLQCPCVCDGLHVYAERRICSGCSGADWAGDVLADDSVAIQSAPPLDTKSYCSEPCLVATTLGIEAAGAVLRKELGPYMQGIDCRHITLLSDAMTYTGEVLGATRSGLRRADAVSVLGRACFETGPTVMSQAAECKASDPLHAASSRMALGLIPRVGAHAVGICTQPTTEHVKPERSFMDQPPVKRFRFDNYMKH